jgi:hypothetical protein
MLIDAAQVGQQVTGQILAACLGGGAGGPSGAARRPCRRTGPWGASGDEVPQQPVQRVEETGAFVGQVIAGSNRKMVV